jgi:hypothetical protein
MNEKNCNGRTGLLSNKPLDAAATPLSGRSEN